MSERATPRRPTSYGQERRQRPNRPNNPQPYAVNPAAAMIWPGGWQRVKNASLSAPAQNIAAGVRPPKDLSEQRPAGLETKAAMLLGNAGALSALLSSLWRRGLRIGTLPPTTGWLNSGVT